jgi:hypothetical protein
MIKNHADSLNRGLGDTRLESGLSKVTGVATPTVLPSSEPPFHHQSEVQYEAIVLSRGRRVSTALPQCAAISA